MNSSPALFKNFQTVRAWLALNIWLPGVPRGRGDRSKSGADWSALLSGRGQKGGYQEPGPVEATANIILFCGLLQPSPPPHRHESRVEEDTLGWGGEPSFSWQQLSLREGPDITQKALWAS